MSVHSSLAMNPALPRYLARDCKHYYLPLHGVSRFQPLTAAMLGAGAGRDRTPEEIRSSFLKARRGEFSHVKIPLDRAGSPLLAQAFALAEEMGLPLVLQVEASALAQAEFLAYLRALSPRHELEVLLEPGAPHGAELRAQFANVYASVLVHRGLRWPAVLPVETRTAFPEVHLYFPYRLRDDQPHLSSVESRRTLCRLRQLFPRTQFLPPKGGDLWDERVKPGFELEPFYPPCFATASAAPAVKYSVVIPTYNNQNHLRVTLRHLFQQDVGPDAFEIIVVDDGSTDQTQALVLELVRAQAQAFNFKYVYFPRSKRRAMGDAQFRAGIARNLGVKNAVGDVLCFLDSDILTPPHYLRTVGETLPRWGALQARRVNLRQKVSHLDCNYAAIQPGRDTESGEAYWDAFTENTRNWHELPFNWKYVCTHSFSLRRDLFWRLGGFKRNFIFYGFEDTDLGYRLTKSGEKLHLLDVTVYHLFHETARSEFMNLSSLRHVLLSRTAQIFYLHHLDDDIFENLRGFMDQEFSWRRLGRNLAGVLALSFLWRPRAPVFASLRAPRRAEEA